MTVPYKRPAGDKSGVPVYQPTGNAAYQQALMQQLGQQSYVPVSCEYSGSSGSVSLGGTQGENHTTSPANHNATASSKDPSISCSSSTAASTSTITNPSSPGKAVSPSLPYTTTTSMAGGITSPMLPPPPVNVFSYTGYALNKGLRPQVKQPAPVVTPGALASHHPQGFTTSMPPVSLSGVGLNLNSALTQMAFPQVQNSAPQMLMPTGTGGSLTGYPTTGLTSIGGVVNQGMGAMPGLGGGMTMLPSSLVYPQYPASSLVLPTYTALSSNPQSLAGAVEQPYKKLKTS